MLLAFALLFLLPRGGPGMEQPQVGTGFKADYERRHVNIESDGTRTERREVFRLYRDGRGRTRLEGSMPSAGGKVLRFAWLMDIHSRRSLVLDLATGTPLATLPPGGIPEWGGNGSHGTPANTARPPDVGAGQVPASNPTEAYGVEDLGESEIESLAAHGWRTTTPTTVSEVWNARAIDQPPLLVRTRTASLERVERLFNVRLGEPDPGLFAPLDSP